MFLELKNLNKAYSSSQFKLENINLTVNENESVGLIGKNGCGKSTILKMINRLIESDEGHIYFEDKDISVFNTTQLNHYRKKVVYIFQNGNLLEKQSVYYHLTLIYKLNKIKVNEKEINEILHFFNLTHLKKIKVYYLSGGQKQKLAIAMAILSKPKLLLCDEISSQLDFDSEIEIFKLLQKIRERYKISMIIVAHNLSILKNYCDKIYVVNNHTIENTIIPKKSNTFDYESYLSYVEHYLYD